MIKLSPLSLLLRKKDTINHAPQKKRYYDSFSSIEQPSIDDSNYKIGSRRITSLIPLNKEKTGY